MKKILIIEDEKNILLLLKIFLEKEGYKVLTADNGLDGMKIAHDNRPDAILLDIILPGMSGITICRILKDEEKTKAIPVIVMSARTSRKDREDIFTAGADEYIPKPFKINDIRSILFKILGEDKNEK